MKRVGDGTELRWASEVWCVERREEGSVVRSIDEEGGGKLQDGGTGSLLLYVATKNGTGGGRSCLKIEGTYEEGGREPDRRLVCCCVSSQV